MCIEGTVQLHSGTLNLLAARAIPVIEIASANAALPRAPERNMIPGYSQDNARSSPAILAVASP